MRWDDVARENTPEQDPQSKVGPNEDARDRYYALTRKAAGIILSGQRLPPEMQTAISVAAHECGMGVG